MLACAAVPTANEDGSTGSLPVSVTASSASGGLAARAPQRRERVFRIGRTHAPTLSAHAEAR